MPLTSKRPTNTHLPQGSDIATFAERTQLDFEIAFFAGIINRMPDYADVLRAQSANYSTKGQLKEGLRIDLALADLLPSDPDIRYNLACRYALLQQSDTALEVLDQAVTLGYRDFPFMLQDRDLESLRNDPRFRQMIRKHVDR
jgi:tetratricopeptide (TPR) repeat protein